MSDTADRTKKQAPAMIERVARLMCARRGWDPDIRESGLIPGREPDGLLAWEIMRDAYMARVIEAISEAGYVIVPCVPTEAMLIGARDWSLAKNGQGVGNDQATGCWRAMIDASLDESR